MGLQAPVLSWPLSLGALGMLFYNFWVQWCWSSSKKYRYKIHVKIFYMYYNFI